MNPLLSLCNGESISVDRSDVWSFVSVARVLENGELISHFVGQESVTVENAVLRIEFCSQDSDVEFACANFCSLDFSSISVEVAVRLLSDPRLTIESEDWLLNVVTDLISHDSKFAVLLDSIECQYLSVESISRFADLVWSSGVNFSVWSSLCRRLIHSVSPTAANPRVRRRFGRSILLDRSRPFDGVFAELWKSCGENPHLAGLIAISAADERVDRKFECHDLISDASKAGKWWGTGLTEIDHHVMIDFKDYQIRPSGYSVKVHNSSWSGGDFVKSWRFEGSTDGTAWQALDSHTDSSELSGNDREASFACQSSSQFRFIRFLMVGLNSSGCRQFSLQRLEVFGELINNDSK
jgi:hypothetical protein